MRKSIIALKGKSDSGKSRTINYLYELLKKRKYEIIKDKQKKGINFNVAIFKINKIRIGLTTYGDIIGTIDDNLKYLVEEKCKLLICACHNTVYSLKAFKNFPKWHIFFIQKSISPTKVKDKMDSINQKDCNRMFSEIIKLLNQVS